MISPATCFLESRRVLVDPHSKKTIVTIAWRLRIIGKQEMIREFFIFLQRERERFVFEFESYGLRIVREPIYRGTCIHGLCVLFIAKRQPLEGVDLLIWSNTPGFAYAFHLIRPVLWSILSALILISFFSQHKATFYNVFIIIITQQSWKWLHTITQTLILSRGFIYFITTR